MTDYRGSEIDDKARCDALHDYAWNQKIEPKRPDNKLFFGTLFHKWVEVYNDELDADAAYLVVDQLFKETDKSGMEQVEIDELEELLETVTASYIEYWHEQDKKRRTIGKEVRFRVPLTFDKEGDYFTGTIDHLFLDDEGRFYPEDHKTTASISQYLHMVNYNRQITRYLWAIKMLGIGIGEVFNGQDWVSADQVGITQLPTPEGFIYNLVSKKPPKPPRILKNGTLSKDKSQRTTHKLYVQAMAELPPDKLEPYSSYEEILTLLLNSETEQGNDFFRRQPVRRSDYEEQHAMTDFISVVDDIKSNRPIYRNVTQNCSWCNYRHLCFAEMSGEDTGSLREMMYQPKKSTENSEDELEWQITSEASANQ